MQTALPTLGFQHRLYSSSGEFAEPEEAGVRMSERQAEGAKQKEHAGREYQQHQAQEVPADLLQTEESGIGPLSIITAPQGSRKN